MLNNQEIKKQILKILKAHPNQLITGAYIANTCNITRSYVSKVVKELIEIGYYIQIKNRSGYIYQSDDKVLDQEYLKKNLKPLMDVIVLDKIDSTNNYLKILAKDSKKEKILVVANMQTAGRGRLGRNFLSNNASGIYMSMLIRPTFNLEYAKKLTCLVASAVSIAIEKMTNLDAKIKWVNDIYINNKKVCGILTEAATQFEGGNLEYIIIGIGVNMYHQHFDDDLVKKVTTIEDESGQIYSRNDLIITIINQVNQYLENITNDIYMEDYIKRSLVINKKVELQKNDTTQEVLVKGITKDGELEILVNNTIQKVTSGEITRMVLLNE